MLQRLAGTILLAVGTAACLPRASLPPLPPAPNFFSEIEATLLEAPQWRTQFTATAEGAFQANLDGTLEVGGSGGTDELTLTATGTFGANAVSARLQSDGRTLTGSSATLDQPAPAFLREAVLLGLTRMGIMHNVARLSSGAAPDHAAGGVREWVQVANVRYDSAAAARFPESVALTFDIIVSGQRTAEATLWADRRGRPLRREQVVTFPGGSMRVTEDYRAIQ